MKLKHLILAATALLTATAATAQINEITRAVLGAYDETLRQDPNDYVTLYRRGVEYCRLGRYQAAMEDVDKALKLTPSKEPDMLMHLYSLKADIYIGLDDLDKALEYTDKALIIDPKSFSETYKKGNILLEQKKSDEAFSTFQSLLRLQSRSQEAMYGMARASVQRGALDDANRYINDMKEAAPSSATTYCRIGDVLCEMGNNEKGVINYITGFSMADGSMRPINSLRRVADTDYPAFKSGFEYAESQSRESAPTLKYIRGVISSQTGHYDDAYEALTSLQATEPTAGLLSHLASVCLHLNKLAEARSYADRAITMAAGGDIPVEALLVKSAAEIASGSPASALLSASKAYNSSNPDPEVLMAQAKAAIAAGESKQALDALNELVLNDAEAVDALLLRSYVKKYMLNDDKGAKADLQRAAKSSVTTFPQVGCKALAETLSGKTLDGQSTLEKALARDSSPSALVSAAVYYAQTGNRAKADEFLKRATDAGYEDIFFMETDRTPYLSLSAKK